MATQIPPYPSTPAQPGQPGAGLTARQIEDREIGADGTFGLVDRLVSTRPGPDAPAWLNALSKIPAEPFGYPLVFWIGGVLFLIILFLTWSSYI